MAPLPPVPLASPARRRLDLTRETPAPATCSPEREQQEGLLNAPLPRRRREVGGCSITLAPAVTVRGGGRRGATLRARHGRRGR